MKTERVRECIRLCSRYGLILIGTASVLLFIFAGPLVKLFTSDPEVMQAGKNYVRIVTFIQWAYVSGFIYIGCLQALKRPMYGFVESVVRKIILPLPVCYSDTLHHHGGGHTKEPTTVKLHRCHKQRHLGRLHHITDGDHLQCPKDRTDQHPGIPSIQGTKTTAG